MSVRSWYSVSGSVERRNGYEWNYDGYIRDELTCANSPNKAKQNALYRYVTDVKCLTESQVRLFRFFNCAVTKLYDVEPECSLSSSKDEEETENEEKDSKVPEQLRLF